LLKRFRRRLPPPFPRGSLDIHHDSENNFAMLLLTGNAAVSRRQCVRQKGRSFLEKTFGGDVGALLAHFVTEASLNQDQIEQLHQLLAQKKKPSERRK
jgi:Penicillinase repressor